MRMSRPGGLGAGPHVFFRFGLAGCLSAKGDIVENIKRWGLSTAGERKAVFYYYIFSCVPSRAYFA